MFSSITTFFQGLTKDPAGTLITMLYVAGGFPAEEYAARKKRRQERAAAKAARSQTAGKHADN